MANGEKERRRRVKQAYLASDPERSAMRASVDRVSAAQIVGAPPGEAEYLVVQQILRMSDDRRAALPAPLRSLYATWIVESEIMNGGFEQLVLNYSEELIRWAEEGYRSFGLETHVAALKLFRDGEIFAAERTFDIAQHDAWTRKDAFIRAHADAFQIGI